MSAKKLWVDYYSPNINSYVFQNEGDKVKIMEYINDGSIPHLLFTGVQGSGKSTLSKILISKLEIDDADILRDNVSSKTGIDYIRDIVTPFVECYPIGKFRIVQLEEFDRLSSQAQDALKTLMEDNSNTCRFICTANRENMINPPIKSRVQHFRFKTPIRDDVVVRMAEILIEENVEFDPEILDKYISQAYPDIRKLINNLQKNTLNGKLQQPTTDVDGNDYQFKLIDLILDGNLREIRKLVTEQCTTEQLEDVYTFLYQNLKKHPVLSKNDNIYEQAIVTLNDGLYKHSLVAIPHLNFEATMFKLSQLIK